MDLKQLRTFMVVAESGSLSGASDRLRLAQPALSRQIKLLEHEIGFELFRRSGRGMEITEHGTALLNRISGLIQQIDSSINDVRSLASEPAGQVVLGIIPSVSYILAGRIAVRVARELPCVSLRVTEAYAGHLINWLHRGEVDVAILYGPASDLHLRVADVMFEELVLVSPVSSTFPHRETVKVAMLDELDLVLPSKPHGLRMVVEAAAGKAAVALRVKYEADSFRVLKELVAEGLGHTILPLSAFYRETAEGLYRISRLVAPRVTRHLITALPSNRVDTRATAAVHRLMLDEIQRMRASGEWATPVGQPDAH